MEKYLNRNVIEKVEFKAHEDSENNPFHAMYEADGWCNDNGYKVGQTCARQPTALMHGDYEWIAKWKNLTKAERGAVDGVMIAPRSSKATIYIFRRN